MRPVPIQPSFISLIRIGNRQLLRGVERDDLGAFRRQDYLLLDARRRDAVARRAIGFDREYHSGLELDRLPQRCEPRNQRPLMQPEAEAVAEVEAEGVHLAREA